MSGEYLERSYACIRNEQEYIKGLKSWKESLKKSCVKAEAGPEDKNCQTLKQLTDDAIKFLSSDNRKKALSKWLEIQKQCQNKKTQADPFLFAAQMSQLAIKTIRTCNGYPLDQEALKKAHKDFYLTKSENNPLKPEDPRKSLEKIVPKTAPHKEKEISLGSGNLYVNSKTGVMAIAEGNNLEVASKEHLKEWWMTMPLRERESVENTLIDQEKQSGITIEFLHNNTESLKRYLQNKKIGLCPNNVFGIKDEDVLTWLSNRASGYPDLAEKLIYLFENKMIPSPPDAENISLSRINGAYQRALERGYETPTVKHSLFLLKMIYEQLYNHYYEK
ncbi:hypothetical protein A2276_08040 [candidate division WOR-1 bacterium RIFOXYA12_FULL_43_27]|uniref:Uncharacterized protein n=1 Tax=candidate division WOR-1 bacterium RIFOXYC2_FULL_46_14 TaxID=1802587 RepID=A0A1F4U5Z7_UNCSA|nr:MAG: hypothetical protein A2276_08040 [candidate division WOR-1 bacterium RIFOXYA12_FULL_43_27]OGC20546.1 MAG: hypothetical protein A2292_05865 [candidate division WOR-1 bacterium RIFOXYB2_FULL_46_45]OGC31717.1 MAG: hypothetical protein A2232_05585 [candidate division WOR-1 bacterium RIFOXYA2_FULL_46_56]OGC40388.1 MAG: hypothetical protein A2438_03895 [candidate division WOR-1 bacterium RIFOXYC2_FULL_46_14]